MAPISVTLTRDDLPTGIVTLLGEHDAYSAARLENELALLLETGMGVVVDLTDATFVDSQTLSVLLAARHDAERAGLGYTLVLPPDRFTQVHRILDMTGLQASFAIFPTLRQGCGRRASGTDRRRPRSRRVAPRSVRRAA